MVFSSMSRKASSVSQGWLPPGIRPLEEKVEVVREFPLPNTQRKLRTFLGLVNFYHRFIPNGATILQPLHSLLKRTKRPSDAPEWTEVTVAAFNNIKHALANASLLVHPTADAPTSVMTDASDIAVGAVLQQHINGQWCPLAFLSRALKPAETRYSTYDRELLAIYLTINRAVARGGSGGHLEPPFQPKLCT